MSDPRYHGIAAIVPFLLAAAVFGVAKLRPERRVPAISMVLVCSVVLSLAVGPWARAIGERPLGGREEVSRERVSALAEAVSLVPAGVAVSASNTAGAHLSARRYMYSVPILGRAEWVVIDLEDPWVVTADSPILTKDADGVRAFAARVEADLRFDVVFERAGVLVLRKSGA